MGGGHHQTPPKVPDWRIYCVDDVPELKAVQRALASHGLKDPWLRNEVWRYQEFVHKGRAFQRMKYMASFGFKYGLAAALLTTVLEHSILPLYKREGEESHH